MNCNYWHTQHFKFLPPSSVGKTKLSQIALRFPSAKGGRENQIITSCLVLPARPRRAGKLILGDCLNVFPLKRKKEPASSMPVEERAARYGVSPGERKRGASILRTPHIAGATSALNYLPGNAAIYKHVHLVSATTFVKKTPHLVFHLFAPAVIWDPGPFSILSAQTSVRYSAPLPEGHRGRTIKKTHPRSHGDCAAMTSENLKKISLSAQPPCRSFPR